MRKFILSALITAITALSLPLTAVADYTQQKLEASRLYQDGDYANSYKEYLELARNGDSFSQYRLSYMHLMGQGKKESVIESLAWSVLAAQNKQEEMIAYMHTVAGMVPQKQRKKADKKISYYMRKWGNESDSGSARNKTKCTGSRLCNHDTNAGSVGVPKNLWNVSDNNTSEEQQLKSRAIDINESILKSQEASLSRVVEYEAS